MRVIVRMLQNTGLLLVTLFVFFGGIEVFLRVSGLVKMQDYTPPIYARNENPLISYTLKPSIREKAFRNWVTTDENGFRASLDTSLPVAAAPRYGTTPPFAKASGGTRDDIIVILGDSITFGYGVADDETLPAKLQKLLPETTVINAGVPGYHIGQEAALYEEKLAKLNPDVLVLVFYWNDFDQKTSWLDETNVLRAEGWQPSEKTCQPIERGILGFIPGKCWLDLHSAFYLAVKEYVNTRAAINERDASREDVGESPQPDVMDGNALTAYEVSLQRLVQVAPKNRIFVIWPDSALHTTARAMIKSIAERGGFDVLDLYEYFGNNMETLSWDYIHPNAASLDTTATLLQDALLPTLYE